MQDTAALLAHWEPVLRRLAAAEPDGDAAHDITHLTRVWGNARALLDHHAEADALVVMAAAYLHDLVNLPKNHPDRARASTLAADKACAALRDAGFPASRLDAVGHAIAAHSFSAGIAPRTLEARIVQDADRLDALGPVGLARMLHIGATLGRAIAHPDDPLARARPLDDARYTLDHIEVKLARLPATMQTEAARTLGQARLDWMQAFRHGFAAQWTGAAPDLPT